MQASAVLVSPGCSHVAEQPPSDLVYFDWIRYSGQDDVFAEPLRPGHYRNPIIAGFYPDPSMVKVGADYYLVNSSFSFAPGLPIFHSTDLVNWRPVGHALTRSSQILFSRAAISQGIYAPTIRYHDGLFYIITTGVESGGNFIVTAKDPAGPWSDPVFLPEIEGIDPDLFFDDDGRVYIAHNGPPPGGKSLYDGHRAIYLWEYDRKAQKVIPPGKLLIDGGTDIRKEPVWIEGPHLYKINGWYYLLCAEGGTAENHSEVVFRAKSLTDPKGFQPWDGNPILTQRDLNLARPNPIETAGHADMVQTDTGEWWATFLATRNYANGAHYNTGRETWLLPVNWQDGWPVILPAGQSIPWQLPVPEGLATTPGAEPMTGNFSREDNFETDTLSFHWTWLRDAVPDWMSLEEKPGFLALTPLQNSLGAQESVAFVAQRQQHLEFEFEAALQLPLQEGVSAGIAALQNEKYHIYFGVTRTGDDYRMFVEKVEDGQTSVAGSVTLSAIPTGQTLVLGVDAELDDEESYLLNFYWKDGNGNRQRVAAGLDGRLLSTKTAGGFVGTTLGMHARLEEKNAAAEPSPAPLQ